MLFWWSLVEVGSSVTSQSGSGCIIGMPLLCSCGSCSVEGSKSTHLFEQWVWCRRLLWSIKFRHPLSARGWWTCCHSADWTIYQKTDSIDLLYSPNFGKHSSRIFLKQRLIINIISWQIFYLNVPYFCYQDHSRWKLFWHSCFLINMTF